MTFRGMYDIRDGKQDDLAFILATFLNGVYYGEGAEPELGRKFYSLIPKDLFMDTYKLVANALITHPNTVVRIACLKEDPDVILGYSILSSDLQTIHWCYVKKAWRDKGIAKSLIPDNLAYASHLSDAGRQLIRKLNLTFNPFIINP